MLVEFAVSKKIREFFSFSPRTKGSKAGLRGNFQIASFPYGNAENMFYNFVVLFFSSVKNGGCEFYAALQAHRQTEAHFTAAGMPSQSRTCGCQSDSVEDQPQCPGLYHHNCSNARSFSHFPSPPPPSFTQSPSPPRSLVRDGQTSPRRPRLVVSRSTCPPISHPHHGTQTTLY